MKKMNKLVALLLAAVMVLGMLPAAAAHAHEYHTHSAEDYPVIALDTVTDVPIATAGDIGYFAFTPEVTDLYHFYSAPYDGEYTDTYGALYDADFNLLDYNDDASYGNTVGVYSPNFCISYVMEGGKTYILAARLYSGTATGGFTVTLLQGHEYTSAVTKEMTCTEDGVLTYTCSHCGESYDEPIPAAHVYGEDTGKCIFCDEVYLLTGSCGDALTWELDFFGNLKIFGTGAMYDYKISWGDDKNPAPWYDHGYDITSITIEDGCTYIGAYAFYQCATVTEIVVPETVTALGNSAFGSCYALEKITLPDAITAIPESCFGSCGALTTFNWPASVTSIGKNAFYGTAIGNQTIPEGVTEIGSYAFSGCNEITKLILPSTLTTLNDYAFGSMWNVTDIVFTGDAPATIGANIFNWLYTNAWYPVGNETWTEEVMQQYGGTVTWIASCATHEYSAWTTVEATCTIGEYMTHSCTVCGWTENSPAGEPLGHDLVETVIEPNCATYEWGRTEITCTRCDYYDSKDWIEYQHDYVSEVIEPTCAEDGYTKYTCTVCGMYYSDNYVYAEGHSIENWSEPTEATCTEDGVKTGTCSKCNETVTEVVAAALGHTWDEENGTVNEDGTTTYGCIRCDATYTTEGLFLYNGDNTFTIEAGTNGKTKTYTATDTGKLTITMNKMVYHNAYAWDNGYTDQYWQDLAIDWAFDMGFFKVYINDVESSFTIQGSEANANIILSDIEVAAGDVVTVRVDHLEASYYDTNDVQFNMNLALESTHTHEYTSVVTEPTCTEAGSITYTCACGDTYTEQLEALGHDYINGKCTRCDDLKTGTFTDVPGGSFCFDAVEWAVEQGITNGATATTFDPNGELQRGQVVTMLWRAAGKPEPTTTENPFSDVPETAFYYKAVLWAVENGITNGTSSTTFDPNGITNRAQAVTFLWRAEGKPEPTTTENPFSDVIEGSFCYKAVLWAVENSITNGVSAGSFGTSQNCNRAQMVTFLYRTAQLPEAEEPEVDGEKYLVLLKADDNGTVICDVTEAAAGEKVTFTAIPNEGYAFTNFQIFDPNGEIDLSTFELAYGENENEYVFTMIAHDLIVDCIFEPAV